MFLWPKPRFTICVYEEHEDKWVSGEILSSGTWETGISQILGDILMNRTNSDTLVLDIGANLGIHGLYAAKLGYRVWAVEPQEKNLIKVSIWFNHHPIFDINLLYLKMQFYSY